MGRWGWGGAVTVVRVKVEVGGIEQWQGDGADAMGSGPWR